MGWQSRDYAKWTDEERQVFLGTATARINQHVPTRKSRTRGGLGYVRSGAKLAILVSAALVALGQFPRSHPILPSLHVDLPGSQSASPGTPSGPPGTISLPSTEPVGSTLTLQGTAPRGNGSIAVQGSYDRGQTWETLATVGSADRTYTAHIALTQSGLLEIRVVFPNGSEAVGSTTVE